MNAMERTQQQVAAWNELLAAAQAWRDGFEQHLSSGYMAFAESDRRLWKAVYAVEEKPFPMQHREATP